MKTLILGLGNTILTDDGVGIYVSREIGLMIGSRVLGLGSKEIVVQETSVGGINFIDILAGYDRAVIIDAIHSKNGSPGEFYEIDMDSLKVSQRISSLHGIDLATASAMAKELGVDFPSEIKIFVMEVEDEFSFGEKCTSKIEAATKPMAEAIIKELICTNWV